MQNIKQILTGMGFNATDEQLEQIDARVRENYITRAEADGLREKNAALTKQAEEMAQQVKAAGEDGEKIAALTKQVEEFQQAEERRKADEDAKARREAFDADFDKVMKDSEALKNHRFANAITEKAVRNAAYEQHEANPDMGIADIIGGVTKDQEGVWANPQQPGPKGMPMPSGKDAKDKAQVADIAHSIFGTKASW